jgi:hypothetical protein
MSALEFIEEPGRTLIVELNEALISLELERIKAFERGRAYFREPLLKALSRAEATEKELKTVCALRDDDIRSYTAWVENRDTELLNLSVEIGRLRDAINNHGGYIQHCLDRCEGVGQEKTSIMRLRAPIKKLMESVGTPRTAFGSAVDGLVEALEWYANPPDSTSIDRDFYNLTWSEYLWLGGGQRARTALAAYRRARDGGGG